MWGGCLPALRKVAVRALAPIAADTGEMSHAGNPGGSRQERKDGSRARILRLGTGYLHFGEESDLNQTPEETKRCSQWLSQT